MEDLVREALRKKYSHLHPLIFKRSAEKAKTNGELFDILSSIPEEYPIFWCETEKCWKTIGLLGEKP